MRFPVFRVVYSTTFTVLLVLLLALLLVSPADGIVQSRRNGQGWNIVVIAAVYILTFLVAVFIYATRKYATHAHLVAIPRAHLPIRRGDVRASVRRLIVDGLEQSARIAYQAHPRDFDDDRGVEPRGASADAAPAPSTAPAAPPPTWGAIAHPGWAPPTATDLPGLHYEPVILELPSIIEAQAVALAPPDPLLPPLPSPSSSHPPPPTLPDPRAVLLLQRAPATTLRAYLARLAALDMLPAPDSDAARAAAQFLPRYEAARFAGAPLREPAFRTLLESFAALLAGLRPPDPARVARLARAASTTTTRPSSSSAAEKRSEGGESEATTTTSAAESTESVVHHRRRHRGNAAGPFEGVAVTATPPLPPMMGLGGDMTTPTPTPFLTPHLAYPTSLSSGHAGDRSGDEEDERGSEEEGSERTAHTAWTRPSGGRTPRPGRTRVRRRGETWVSAREERASPALEGPRRASGESEASGGSRGREKRYVEQGAGKRGQWHQRGERGDQEGGIGGRRWPWAGIIYSLLGGGRLSYA